jgi:spore maturation protein CgeB
MKVPSLTNEERASLYHRTKIGFNMHLSTVPRETGNMRMYEIPAHGMMQVCDIAGCNSHEMIFKGGSEAVYYGTVEEAIDRIEYFLGHDEERIRIAKAGYERVGRDYRWESCFRALLDWASTLVPGRKQQFS